MTNLLPGIKLGSTKDILGINTRIAMLLWSASGKGKTTLAGSLHDLTMKFMGKPTLFIGVESGEGGGAVTIHDKDIPLYIPKNLPELQKVLAQLKNDKEFGGIVLDSATELAKAFIKPTALQYPCREKSPTILGARAEGVPAESDYMIMGELMRQILQTILNITANPDPALSKHAVVTALDKIRSDREDREKINFWGPNLPGAMGPDAAGMFQMVATIDVKGVVDPTTKQRVVRRFLRTSTSGPEALKDRFKIFPGEVMLKTHVNDPVGEDLCSMWEKYWIPKINERSGG